MKITPFHNLGLIVMALSWVGAALPGFGKTGLRAEAIEEDVGYFCQAEAACQVDDETGLHFEIFPGWIASYPYQENAEAPIQATFFDSEHPEITIFLNPVIAPKNAGEGDPICLPIPLGRFCAQPKHLTQQAVTHLLLTMQKRN